VKIGMATIYEVSKLAGVSLATVSRVINESGNVTPKTRDKVLSAIKELGYRPNSMAQSLASKHSNSVGVLIPELYGPFFGVMLSSIEAELHDAGKRTIVTAGHSDAANEQDCIEFLLRSSCEALIVHVQAVADEYLIELSKGDVPIICLNRHIPELAARCISLDNEHGGYIATRALLERGHKKLAYISGPSWKMDSFKRLAGHRRALEEFDLDFDERLVFEGDFEETSGREGVMHLLQLEEDFTGLVCANDEMAAGAMDTARAQGLRIPEDLSVIGYDDVAFTRFLNPQLSSINCRIHEMGQMAARAVLKYAYNQQDLVIQKAFKPHVVLRASVGSR
jgi:LacI family transcriptional regulator